MYIRVYKKDGKWVRKDGSLVGKEIKDENVLKLMKIAFGKNLFVIDGHNKIYTIYYGYLDENGNFIRFCTEKKENCSFCPKLKRSIFCRRISNKRKDKTAGYYISD